jgi:hypothetical protein
VPLIHSNQLISQYPSISFFPAWLIGKQAFVGILVQFRSNSGLILV